MKLGKNILAIVILIVLIFGLYYSGIFSSITASGQTYDQNSVTFQYPDDWQEAKSVAEGSVAAVADPNDSRTSIVIQQVPSEYGDDIQAACSNNNKLLAQYGNYISIQEVKTTVNNNTAIIHRYIINEADGSQKEHVATWIKMSDNKMYVLLLSTPVESYESVRSGYDLVVGTFKIKTNSNNSILDLFNN
ncbi:PsbP-related protein [Methanosphaera sp.]